MASIGSFALEKMRSVQRKSPKLGENAQIFGESEWPSTGPGSRMGAVSPKSKRSPDRLQSWSRWLPTSRRFDHKVWWSIRGVHQRPATPLFACSHLEESAFEPGSAICVGNRREATTKHSDGQAAGREAGGVVSRLCCCPHAARFGSSGVS